MNRFKTTVDHYDVSVTVYYNLSNNSLIYHNSVANSFYLPVIAPLHQQQPGATMNYSMIGIHFIYCITFHIKGIISDKSKRVANRN